MESRKRNKRTMRSLSWRRSLGVRSVNQHSPFPNENREKVIDDEKNAIKRFENVYDNKDKIRLDCLYPEVMQY